MNFPTVLLFCNAIEDTTRIHRCINTDSPAASRKVFMLCEALRLAGVKPYVISLGRGRANGSKVFYKRSVRCVGRIPTIYAPFCHIPFLSPLLTIIGQALIILRFVSCQNKAAIFYNRRLYYLPSLFLASLFRFNIVLDLEDGEVSLPRFKYLNRFKSSILYRVFDKLCRNGALLACSALSSYTLARPTHCYYGISEKVTGVDRFSSDKISVLMSGTLSVDTGAELLLETIQIIASRLPILAKSLCFEITGMGPSLDKFSSLFNACDISNVFVHGRLSNAEYKSLLARCSVGLALKPPHGNLANTTFPSKVIEYASAGLLVITTDISDVRMLFDDTVLYVAPNHPEILIKLLELVVNNRSDSLSRSLAGQFAVQKLCSPLQAGNSVRDFIFGDLL